MAAVTAHRLPVSEAFGPVWQGEGPHAGRRCSFLRLGLCNLSCEWCDTPWTWDRTRFDLAAENPRLAPEDVLATLAAHGTDLLILTGGEPMIHARHRDLRAILDGWPGEVHVETNGTIRPPEWMLHRIAHWTVSPKLANAATKAARLNANPLDWGVLARLGRASVKFVAVTPGDLDEAATWVDMGSIPREAVWIMPEGTDGATVVATARLLADDVAARGWNLTLRQQVLLYGRERAR